MDEEDHTLYESRFAMASIALSVCAMAPCVYVRYNPPRDGLEAAIVVGLLLLICGSLWLTAGISLIISAIRGSMGYSRQRLTIVAAIVWIIPIVVIRLVSLSLNEL